MRLLAACLLFNCFLFSFTACNNDSALNTLNVKGVWAEETSLEEFDTNFRVEYNFNDEGIVEILTTAIDKDSGEILGYRYKSTGNYTQFGNNLSFDNLTSYNNDDSKGPYSELQDLIKGSEGYSFKVTFEIAEDGKKLTFFYPPCGELANCISTQTFIKAM